jgi:hypothetical protein
MIIECKCKKYTFDIPDNEIEAKGRYVKCGFCDDEWFHNNISVDIPLPEKTKKEEEEEKPIIKKNKNSILLKFVIFLIILFIGLLSNQNIILAKYPNLSGFFESADILKEIVIQNANWVKEIFQDLFKQ